MAEQGSLFVPFDGRYGHEERLAPTLRERNDVVGVVGVHAQQSTTTLTASVVAHDFRAVAARTVRELVHVSDRRSISSDVIQRPPPNRPESKEPCDEGSAGEGSASYPPISGLNKISSNSGDVVSRVTTSDARREAWESIQAELPERRRRVYDAIERAGERGLTCEEAERALSLRHQSCSARVSELKKAGLIVESGLRPTSSGRRAVVWTAAKRVVKP